MKKLDENDEKLRKMEKKYIDGHLHGARHD